MVFALIWIGFGVVTALAAGARGRNPWAWLLIGSLAGIFGLVAVLVMEDLGAARVLADTGSRGPGPSRSASPPTSPFAETYRGVEITGGPSRGFHVGSAMFLYLADARRHIDGLKASADPAREAADRAELARLREQIATIEKRLDG